MSRMGYTKEEGVGRRAKRDGIGRGGEDKWREGREREEGR